MKTALNSETESAAIHAMHAEALDLLKKIISIHSSNRKEEQRADIIERFLRDHYVFTFRKHNNIFCYNLHFDYMKPTILLSCHHDRVKPPAACSKDPFSATIENSKLYGLGSNDADGALSALMAVFLYLFKRRDLPCNICLAITAGAENSGEKGIKNILKQLLPVSLVIVGEPFIFLQRKPR